METVTWSSVLLSGAEGLSSLTSIGTSSRFFTMRAERTVMTFLALPSIVMENTTLTGGRAENWGAKIHTNKFRFIHQSQIVFFHWSALKSYRIFIQPFRSSYTSSMSSMLTCCPFLSTVHQYNTDQVSAAQTFTTELLFVQLLSMKHVTSNYWQMTITEFVD